MAKKNAAPTKSEILGQISKDTELSKKQVADVFDSLNGIVKKSLKQSGLFTLPGLLKMKVVKKPATKAREGVNPFTGEKMTFKAKPANKKVRNAALKNLKEMVNKAPGTASSGAFQRRFPLRASEDTFPTPRRRLSASSGYDHDPRCAADLRFAGPDIPHACRCGRPRG